MADTSQLSTDVDFLTSQPGWQDAPKRGAYIRDVAAKSLQDDGMDPVHHAAVIGELWKRSDERSAMGKVADFIGNASAEIAKSLPAAGGAGVLALSDAAGVTDSGSGTRLKRGVAGLADAAAQRVKSLHPNDMQEQRDSALDALKADLDARAYPDGLEAWVSGAPDAELDDDTKQWVHGLTFGLAKKAVAADYSGELDDEKVRSWLESDRNPARRDSDTDPHGPRALLGDYLVTRDPSSWEAFAARVKETDAQHTTRLQRFASEAELRQVQSASSGGLLDDLTTRSAEFQTSPIDMAATVLPFLRGAKAFAAARAGSKGAAVSEAVKGVAIEAGSEGLTEALQDPNAGNSQIALAAGMGATGAGVLTGTATGAGMIANQLSAPTNSASVTGAPSSEAGSTPAAGTSEGATDADFGVLAQIAASAGREAVPTTVSEPSPQAIPLEASPEQTAPTTEQPVEASTVDSPATSVEEVAPEPAPVKFRSFDQHGRLKATKEAPREEAMKELRGRESMLQKLFDCLGRKVA